MAEKTLNEYILDQLDKPVKLKGGEMLKDPEDGHVMTATEAIAWKITQNALSGDLKAAQFVMQLEATRRLTNKK